MAAGPTYEPIATTTLGSATTTFTFSSIPGTYTDLVIIIEGPGISGGTSMDVDIRFNSDSSSVYSDTRLQNAGCDANHNGNLIRVAAPRSNNRWNTAINIFNYADTSYYKTLIVRSNINSTTDPVVEMYSGCWRNTSAITSFTLFSGQNRNFEVGTICTLFGIAAA